jgi:hypothetical protein
MVSVSIQFSQSDSIGTRSIGPWSGWRIDAFGDYWQGHFGGLAIGTSVAYS